jgi:hypothetical protein
VYNLAKYIAETATWDECVDGITNQAEAEALLAVYADLYQRFRSIEKVPDDFSDKKVIVEYDDAYRYLMNKGLLMGRRRVSLSVPYSKGKSYFFGKHIMVALPHQTMGYSVEAIVERVSKNKNKNLVSLDLVLIEDIQEAWQNTVDTGTEYQNNETTGTEYQKI